MPMGLAGDMHNPTHKHGKCGPTVTKLVFIRYPAYSKGHVVYREYHNGGMIEIDSHNINFLEDDFLAIREIKKYAKLYELQ